MSKTDKNYSTFIKIWVAQFISILGTSTTSFALSIWIVQNSNNASQAIFAGLFDWLPVILFASIAGYVADKYNKKYLLVGFDIIAALTSILLLILVLKGVLNIYIIYILTFISTTCDTFQTPVNSTLIPILVPEEKFQNANGLVSLTSSIKAIIAPIAGAILITVIGLQGILIIDLSTFVICIIIIATIPARLFKIATVSNVTTQTSKKEEFLAGFSFIKNKKGFLPLVIYMSLLMFFVNSAVITTPLYVLSFSNETMYVIAVISTGIGAVMAIIYASSYRNVKIYYLQKFKIRKN